MESDSDTQSDVDLLILDYLLCTSIYGLVHTRGVEAQEQTSQCDLDWHIDTVYAIKSVFPHSGLLPDDFQAKVRLFEFANALRWYPNARVASQIRQPGLCSSGYWPTEKPISLSELTETFITLCRTIGTRLPEATWGDIAAQFVVQAAVEEYRKSESSASLSKHIAWAKKMSDQTANMNEAFTKCISYLQPPHGASLSVHMRIVSTKFPIDKFKCAVFDTLAKIMKVLEPPVLIQLERGQLWGLSRAETKQLKERVGLK
ncbi:hypothetical protein BDV26DRAFT_268136 [Aspergillus bertholletiae]|uniref:Uncharacterized protein n=1 Tax=Aspergillus bertholletiae TaxID=1226010 RepID=A0A5N7B1X0_9EURO|nr:hypothetical protein BDV26DRAFT_268136 [Aspergillus bertholletiae]